MKLQLSIFVALAILQLACQAPDQSSPRFEHDVDSGPRPWTTETFELEEDDFTFGIISDLNGGEREGVYQTAVAQLNRIEPTFVLSIGDLIDGGTEDSAQLAAEWDSFAERTAKLTMPFFYLGGNHDLTNPKMREFWKNRFGPRYYYFVYENVLFLMLDSEDYEEERMLEIYQARSVALQVIKGEIEGKYEDTEYYKMEERRLGAISEVQLEYFTSVLSAHPDVRWTFVLMHKPLWMREGAKGLSELEKHLVDRPYTVFNGHFHSFSHRKRAGRDYMILGTTGGSQNPTDSMSFDHVTTVRMAKEPVITHIRMDGILDETGRVPAFVEE